MRHKFGLLLLLITSGTGCAMRGNAELLEAHLRESEKQAETLETQLAQTQRDLELATKSAGEFEKLAQNAGISPPILLEHQQALIATKLSVNPMTSGIRPVSTDAKPEVVLTVLPQSSAGDPVTASGDLTLKVTSLDQSRVLWSQTWSREELAGLWHEDWLTTGYRVPLPLAEITQEGEVEVHVLLKLVTGGQLKTSLKSSDLELTQRTSRLVTPPTASAEEKGRRPIVTSDNWTTDSLPMLR